LKEPVNKMNAENLGVVFGVLLICKSEGKEKKTNINKQST